jgi:hypothetical protein
MIANKFKRLYPCFRGPAKQLDYYGNRPSSEFGGIRIWRPVIGSNYDLTRISAFMLYRNEIPMAMKIFSRSANVQVGIHVISFLLPVSDRHL